MENLEVPEGFPNYTGPYISNGKVQTSVEFGDKTPKDALDALSRLHDSAYAKWDDRLHRTVADDIYNKEAKKLIGKFPELAGFLVEYGNWTGRSIANIASGYGSAGFVGALYGGVKNLYDLNDYLINGEKTRKEILKYYETDPLIHLQGGNYVLKPVTKIDPFDTIDRDPLDINGELVDNNMDSKNQLKQFADEMRRIEADRKAAGSSGSYIGLPPIRDEKTDASIRARDQARKKERESQYNPDFRDNSFPTVTMKDGVIDQRPTYYYPDEIVTRPKIKHLKRRKRRRPLYSI